MKDVIYRDDAIDLCTRFIEGEPRGWVKHAIRELRTALLGLSQVDVISRGAYEALGMSLQYIVRWMNFEKENQPITYTLKGEWVKRDNGNVECSVCHHERQDGWDNFCGYCGADMRKVNK